MSKKTTRWFIISNRLPFVYDEDKQILKPGSGGLITAISGIRAKAQLKWMGSVPAEMPAKLLKTLKGGKGMDFLPVPLKEDLYDSYYNGFCNDVLWPLFHYESESTKFRKQHWESYQKVNTIFADYILKHAREDDLIWVHDFHFMTLPGMVRRRNPRLKIGFFLHVPFPSSEVYRQLPVREEIMKGMMGADLVGFHDYAYLRHFASSVYHVLGIHPDTHRINVGRHSVKLGVFPVSIDSDAFERKAKSPKARVQAGKYKKSWKGTKVILGVDRLDYIKGIKLKLRAFQRLLEKNPALVGKVTLVQIAVPSRTHVDEYIALRHDIEHLVGQINGKFSTPGYVPVTYLFQSVSADQLMALYRTASVLFISSKRDGLNLVSMEYVAVQNPRDPGVVVLSEFAGASAVLSHCILINPWDEEQTSDALNRALNLGLKKRREAHASMRNFLRSYNASDWAGAFMKSLQSGIRQSQDEEVLEAMTPKHMRLIRSELSKGPVTLLTDYDGTLVPIVSRPEDAVLPGASLQKLRKIRSAGARLVLVSGRVGKFLMQQVGSRDFDLASDHGARYFNPKRRKWVNLVQSDRRRWFPKATEIMNDFAKRVPDSFVEEKDFALVWHFRRSPVDFGEFMARKLMIELEDALTNLNVIIEAGKKVVEVKSMEANKGEFLRWLIRNDPPNMRYLCIGDDRTDEDMFRAVGDRGVSIKVGPEPTVARYRLDDQDDVFRFLGEIFLRQKGRRD